MNFEGVFCLQICFDYQMCLNRCNSTISISNSIPFMLICIVFRDYFMSKPLVNCWQTVDELKYARYMTDNCRHSNYFFPRFEPDPFIPLLTIFSSNHIPIHQEGAITIEVEEGKIQHFLYREEEDTTYPTIFLPLLFIRRDPQSLGRKSR